MTKNFQRKYRDSFIFNGKMFWVDHVLGPKIWLRYGINALFVDPDKHAALYILVRKYFADKPECSLHDFMQRYIGMNEA